MDKESEIKKRPAGNRNYPLAGVCSFVNTIVRSKRNDI